MTSTQSAPEVIIRPENATDHPAVRAVNEAAFHGAEEADIVDALRREGAILLSLVAELDRRVVGHILFSRMSIEASNESIAAVALAPMAVLPGHQRQGIGGRLIANGLERLREMGERIVIVVGHPDYYPRFGFSSALARRLESPFDREAFMALELSAEALGNIRGRVRYPPAFGI